MSLQSRTSGLSFEVDDALRGVLTLGWLEADGVKAEPLSPGFGHECDDVIQRLTGRFTGRPAGDIPGVAENRAMFHRLGVDPTKTRPASEALLRRAMQGKGLPTILPAVDVCNLASLEHQLPIGLYDRAHVKGAVFARTGRAGEGYEGIRKGRVSLTQRPLLADDDGPFGAPTSDSARTQVTGQTRSLLAVVFCPIDRRSEDLSAMLARVADFLARYCEATVHLVRTVQ
ncbi:MAG: phenylalanine--tRNA ligase beta subunit-related protein [Candidatus Eisenbacteria bacterium]